MKGEGRKENFIYYYEAGAVQATLNAVFYNSK
jgi:hypothetical protein